MPHSLLRERGGDELHGIVARPFGRPRDGADLAAVAIDQQGRRHAGGAADDLQVLEYLCARVGVVVEVVDAGLLEPGARLLGIARIDIDRDHVEILAAELALQRVERRHLLAAGDAPSRPQVDQDGAAAPVGQVPFLVGSVVEDEIGQARRLVGDSESGDLAMRERRDALRQGDGGGAGPVGRIALEGADPVYRACDRADEDEPQERSRNAEEEKAAPALGGRRAGGDGHRCPLR